MLCKPPYTTTLPPSLAAHSILPISLAPSCLLFGSFLPSSTTLFNFSLRNSLSNLLVGPFNS